MVLRRAPDVNRARPALEVLLRQDEVHVLHIHSANITHSSLSQGPSPPLFIYVLQPYVEHKEARQESKDRRFPEDFYGRALRRST